MKAKKSKKLNKRLIRPFKLKIIMICNLCKQILINIFTHSLFKILTKLVFKKSKSIQILRISQLNSQIIKFSLLLSFLRIKKRFLNKINIYKLKNLKNSRKALPTKKANKNRNIF